MKKLLLIVLCMLAPQNVYTADWMNYILPVVMSVLCGSIRILMETWELQALVEEREVLYAIMENNKSNENQCVPEIYKNYLSRPGRSADTLLSILNRLSNKSNDLEMKKILQLQCDCVKKYLEAKKI